MKRVTWILLISLVYLLVPIDGFSNDFHKKLGEMHMSLIVPEGFESVVPKENVDISCDFAFRHSKKRVEVRYALFPEAQSQEPLESTFATIASNASGKDKMDFLPGGVHPPASFDPQDVATEFGADSGLTLWIDLRPGPSGDYTKCHVLALSKNGLGQAFIFRLYDNVHALLDTDLITFYSLKFSSNGR